MRPRLFYGVFLLLALLAPATALSQVPGEHWEIYQTPEDAGWSAAGLEAAKARFEETGAGAYVVVYDGRILVAWGDVTRRYMCHSVRKSFLSALYGVHVDAGTIDIDRTLSDLSIDDISPLSDAEKQATIRDLLKSRSGVYHSAAYETLAMKAARPERGSHEHNTFWYYNNWDFNALGAIFEQQTGADIFEEFERRFATPLQMEDYRVMDGYHHLEAEHSQFPAYPFKMSARDMARFGVLFMREGEWNGKRIISREWVEESTTPYSKARLGGYAYMWWTDVPEGKPDWYFALGYGGHVIAVNHAEKVVIVQRVDTYAGHRVTLVESTAGIKAVMDAKTGTAKKDPAVAVFDPPQTTVTAVELHEEILDRYARTYGMREQAVTVERLGTNLLLESPSLGNFRLFPLSKKKFFAEDLEWYALFDFADGVPYRVTLHRTNAVADFYTDILENGVVDAIRRYRDEKMDGGTAFTERELNTLGLQLLGTEQVDAAVAVLALNAQAHPSSYNAYHSLGEAHLSRGDEKEAIECYEKSLELNPQNMNAQEKLRELRARPGGEQ